MLQKSYDNKPTLYLIPTPIGNLEDITYRALNVLNSVEVIFTEDTRVTGLLLKHFNISKKMISSHKFNEYKNKDKLLSYLNDGYNVGLVSDRGTPIISDPGYELVKIALKNNYNVVALPGATAFVPALVASGLYSDRFLFYGFLSNKVCKLKRELTELKDIKQTIIFYEAPHRLIETLMCIKDIFGNRNISVSREISKMYEEIYRGKIEDILNNEITLKGEFVIVVEGNNDNPNEDINIFDEINKLFSSSGRN